MTLFNCIGGILLFVPSTLHAQYICGPRWLEGLQPIDGTVYGASTWDPDGAGPTPPLLIVGGSFATVGGVAASNIAAFDGTTWSPLGSGTNDIPMAFTDYNGDLIVGGCFTMAGGVPANYVARWDGTNWWPMGNGLNKFVYSLAVYYGELYAGGWFTLGGTQSVARWDGSNWQPVGGGMGIYGCSGTCETVVNALRVYNNELVAGGYFTLAGGSAARNIACWSLGSWHSLGGGADNVVNALAEYNGKLIVGGLFTHVATSNIVANRIASWTGSWSTLGGGFNNPVWGLAANNGHLYAGGSFSVTGSLGVNYTADWNGTAWTQMGVGVDSTVNDLTTYDGDVIAVGNFGTAGGHPSSHWARWRDTPPPQIVTQPTGTSVMFGECASFSTMATGTGTLHYQWRKNGIPLSDDDRIGGAATANVTICPLVKADQSWYDVVATDACRSTTSAAAYLTVLCPGGIQSQPASQSVQVGEDAHFCVAASGVGTLQYQWSHGSVPLVDDDRISGANSADLTISRVGMIDARGRYSVVVTDDCSSRTSASAELMVTCPGYVSADLNHDCDVDVEDLSTFDNCASGPGVPHSGSWTCIGADFDTDGDVDQTDFSILQRCYSGENVPADPNCAK